MSPSGIAPSPHPRNACTIRPGPDSVNRCASSTRQNVGYVGSLPFCGWVRAGVASAILGRLESAKQAAGKALRAVTRSAMGAITGAGVAGRRVRARAEQEHPPTDWAAPSLTHPSLIHPSRSSQRRSSASGPGGGGRGRPGGTEDSLRLREVAAVRWRQANQKAEDWGSSSCAGSSQGRDEAPAHQRHHRPPIVTCPDSQGVDGDGVTGTGLGGERRSPAAGTLGGVPAQFTSGLGKGLSAPAATRLRRPPATANSCKQRSANQQPKDQMARVKEQPSVEGLRA